MPFTFNEISQCGKTIFYIDIVFTPITIAVLGLRFWAARYARRKLSLDDAAVVIAFLSGFTLSGWATYASFYGLGMYITALTPFQILTQVKLLLVSEFLYLLGTAFVKFSMLFLYRRIYTTPTFRRWCHVVIVLNLIYIVAFIPIFLTNCIPLSQYWDPKPTGWCRDTLISDNATVAVNLFLDLCVLALPLPVLWRLQMSVRDKLTVTSMFSIGIITIALVLWRLGVTLQTRESPDWTSSLCQVGKIATLEIHLGIIAVCIPTLGPVFNAYLKPVLNRMGLAKTAARSRGPRSYLETFSGTGLNKRSRAGYTGFDDSMDNIVSRDNSIKLTPTVEGKVVADCAFEPAKDTRKADAAQGGIRVERNVEATYHGKKGPFFDD